MKSNGNAYQFACIFLFTFGFVNGSFNLIHVITGGLAHGFIISFSTVLSYAQFLGFMAVGLLGLRGNPFVKYAAISLLFIWLYFQFSQLLWPLVRPGFFGDSGWSAWKRALDVIGVGILQGVSIAWATWVLFAGLSLHDNKAKEGV